MKGLPRCGPSNGYKVVLFADFRRSVDLSGERSSIHLINDMAKSAQALNINMLHNVYVVEELIQLTIESNAKIIDRRSCVGLFTRILLRLLHQCLIGSMPLRHKKARVGERLLEY